MNSPPLVLILQEPSLPFNSCALWVHGQAAGFPSGGEVPLFFAFVLLIPVFDLKTPFLSRAR